MLQQASVIELTAKDVIAIERLLASGAMDAAAKFYAGIFCCSLKDARQLVSRAIQDIRSGGSIARTRPVGFPPAEVGNGLQASSPIARST